MKGGVAMALVAACTVPEPVRDVTYVFYDCEEVEADRNGLGRIARTSPDWLAADLAVLGEPTEGLVEGGCQGTLRVDVTARGRAAHSARAWRGVNAIHGVADVLARLQSYEPRRPVVDGLEYHEGLQAVGIEGGIAGNVVPDVCTVHVNHRFAPDRDVDEAFAHVQEVLAGLDVTVELRDAAAGARPGLDRPAARAFVEAVGPSRGSRPAPSSAGPTSPGSPRSACPPSTSVPATRSWPTPTTSASPWPSSSPAARPSSAGCGAETLPRRAPAAGVHLGSAG